MAKLAGKVAVVTGASKGIGAAIARAFAAAGASVAVNYASSKEGADRVVAEIRSKGGSAIAVQGSVAIAKDVESIFAATMKVYDRLDILVNNAGIYSFASLGDTTVELFHEQFNINVLGLILASKEAVKHMGPEGGSIINIGSLASRSTPPNSTIYSATKGAVDAVTGVLAKELGPRKIRVNSVNPGLIETEGTHAAGSVGGGSLRRFGQPRHIASIAVFLASADSGWMTGETLFASGFAHG